MRNVYTSFIGYVPARLTRHICTLLLRNIPAYLLSNIITGFASNILTNSCWNVDTIFNWNIFTNLILNLSLYNIITILLWDLTTFFSSLIFTNLFVVYLSANLLGDRSTNLLIPYGTLLPGNIPTFLFRDLATNLFINLPVLLLSNSFPNNRHFIPA